MVESADPKPRVRKVPVPSGNTRTYEIEFSDGSAIRVDIPEEWRVTYGPIVGAAATGGEMPGKYRNRASLGGNAFRAWENENRQRLLLTGVVSFRDIALPMLRRAVRKFGTSEWMEDDGSWKGSKSEQVQKSWRAMDDPDVIEPEGDL